MKKITLLVSQKHDVSALNNLRKLGAMHIKHMREPQARYISDIEHKLSVLDRVLNIASDFRGQVKKVDKEKLSFYAKNIVELDNQKLRAKDRLRELEQKKIWFDIWGDISVSSLTELEKKGVFIKLYICSKKEFKASSSDELIYAVGKRGTEHYIAHISDSRDSNLGFKKEDIPQEGLHSLDKKTNLAAKDLESIEKKLANLLSYKEGFIKYKEELLKSLEFNKVRFGMANAGGISVLQGFCPQENFQEINKLAKKQGWGIAAEEPDNPDETPTLIKYPKWAKIIEPVFKLIGTIPGYKEFDIAPWFLVFFSLFFAMLIGDAGYGLLFLVITLFMHKKFPAMPRASIFLLYVLSGSTLTWGAITGTWFGVEQIARLPFFSHLVVDSIDTFVSANQSFLIYLCFIIGAIHLSIAHTIAAIRRINSLVAIAHAGWICILWGMFFLAGSLILSKPFPLFAPFLLYSGIGSVLLFSNPQKNILKGVAIALGNLPLKLISCFGDILSYMRLFAVGYASVMVAVSCNQMAQGVGFGSFVSGLLAVLILFIGHSINIILGVLSVLVHGLRLNMLEFSGHLGMEWAGKEYKPFRE